MKQEQLGPSFISIGHKRHNCSSAALLAGILKGVFHIWKIWVKTMGSEHSLQALLLALGLQQSNLFCSNGKINCQMLLVSNNPCYCGKTLLLSTVVRLSVSPGPYVVQSDMTCFHMGVYTCSKSHKDINWKKNNTFCCVIFIYHLLKMESRGLH